jgi:hypothetical protein
MSASWSKKDPSENFVVDFNFPDATVNLTAATVTVELVSGTDATPEAMLVGSVTLVGKTAQQRVGVGQPGCRYNFKCVASAGTNVYTVVTTMPVEYASAGTGALVVTDYTSFDEVRAALGVSDEEVGDATLGLPMYGNHLEGEMQALADDLALTEDIAETVSTISAIAPASRTKPQKRVLSNVALFATYAVARHLGTSLAMMAPKAITDGKAGFTRFSDGPYKSVLLQVEKQYENTRNALAGALSTLNSTVASDIPLVFFGVASPATDPVIE